MKMKIERLLYQVSPQEFTKDFLQADSEVWTPWLRKQKGFLNKTTRIVSPGMAEILIFWKSDADYQRASEQSAERNTVSALMRSRSPGSHILVASS